MSNFTSRSRGRSLSVKQLIDERIQRLEEQEIAEVDAEFSQKHAAVLNSIRVKALRLKNGMASIESLEATASSINQSIGAKFGVLLDILNENCVNRHSLGKHRDDLGESIKNLICQPESLVGLVDIDGYVDEILQFDESIKSRFTQYLDNSNPESLEEVMSKRIEECIHSTLIDGVSEALRRGAPSGPVEAPTLYQSIPKHQYRKFNSRSEYIRSNNIGLVLPEQLESANLILRRLQAHSELEYHIQRQIDEELSVIDAKYLKLIAEVSFAVHEEAMKTHGESSATGLDALWTKKVVPAILKSNDTLLKDVVRVLSSYVTTQYSTNRRIQKLVQIESSKSIFN